MKTLIYDCEIKHGVVSDDNPAQAGFKYAESWTDFTGMGIATLCAYDVDKTCFRVFCDDNLDEITDYIRDGYVFTGFNNRRFDDLLLAAHGISLPDEQSLDLAARIWYDGAGIGAGERPSGMGLDACCKANGLRGKTGEGKNAPQDYQSGRVGRVINYCLSDVRITLGLYRYIAGLGGLVDPRDPRRWLTVALPR